MSNPAIDITGCRFGFLTAICRTGNEGTRATWICICDCGRQAKARGSRLRNGQKTDCGCRFKSKQREGAISHGETGSLEYHSWQSMRQRCLNSRHTWYHNYGGRGIKVCARWDSYENFLSDMGRRPSKSYSIHRIDNELGYFPENCKWANAKEQASNRRPRCRR